ncbi:MAG: hypothetical protein J6Z79_03165 [Clostridia bacterium]|nr:hypothetical protein [Clostridia bacterium]
MKLVIDETYAGLTLKRVLFDKLKFSRAAVGALKKREDGILVNGEHRTVRYTLRTGDEVTLALEDREPSPKVTLSPGPLEILYEDEWLLAVNKPPHMAVHPSKKLQDDTLAGRVLYHRYPMVFRAAGRLDRDTSGVVISAKNKMVSGRFFELIRAHRIRKEYLVLTESDRTPPVAGVIDLCMRRRPDSYMVRYCFPPDGTEKESERALTEFRLLASAPPYHLFQASPITGRTHQLRAHFSAIGFPLAGDTLYHKACPLIDRQGLHAYRLSFPHPVTGEPLSIAAPLPQDLRRALESAFGEVPAPPALSLTEAEKKHTIDPIPERVFKEEDMEFDVLFFEALGEERRHLMEELDEAKVRGEIPRDLKALIVPENLQEYRKEHPTLELPDILSTKTHSRLPEDWINSGRKKSVITRSAGYDHFEALRDRVNVASLRNYCVNAVAETAIKLLMLCAGNFNQYEGNTARMERNACISFKELTGRRVTVFGVGRIGKRIYDLCAGMGFDVRGVDIRAEELKKEYGDAVRFISPEEAAKDSEAVICAMNYTADPASRLYNAGYFSEAYLARFPAGLIFINVTRGEIAPEGGLKALWDKGRLFGIGVDVFSREAGLVDVLLARRRAETPDEAAQEWLIRSALDRSANVYVQPHQAFNSDKAALDKATEAIKHLAAWYKNNGERFDEQLPYYE